MRTEIPYLGAGYKRRLYIRSRGDFKDKFYMKKGEVYEGIIEKVEFPNKGYVMVEDQRVLVKNGIPGQRIRFMIKKA